MGGHAVGNYVGQFDAVDGGSPDDGIRLGTDGQCDGGQRWNGRGNVGGAILYGGRSVGDYHDDAAGRFAGNAVYGDRIGCGRGKALQLVDSYGVVTDGVVVERSHRGNFGNADGGWFGDVHDSGGGFDRVAGEIGYQNKEDRIKMRERRAAAPHRCPPKFLER